MSAVLWSYFFSTTLVEPPAVNRVELNAGHPYTTATKAWLSEERADGINVKTTLLQVPAGAVLHLQDHQYSDRWVEFATTGAAIDKGAYVELPIAWDSNSSLNLYNGNIVEVLFVTSIDLTTPPPETTEPPTIPYTFSHVVISTPLVSLATAKQHLRITDALHDADISQKLAAAQQQILSFLQYAADPTWTDTTLPTPISNAMLILTSAFYEVRGGEDASENLKKAWDAIDLLLKGYRDPALA